MNPKLLLGLALVLIGSWTGFCGEIHDAAEIGDLEKVKKLIQADPSLVASKSPVDAGTPLHFAAIHNRVEMANFLLENKADIEAKDKYGETPLLWAALYAGNNKEMVAFLVTNKADVRARGFATESTALHYAAARDCTNVVQLLLDHKVEVDAKDKEGKTPLHVAVELGAARATALLLENKSDINLKDGRGRTPLRLAILNKQDKIAGLLRNHGANE